MICTGFMGTLYTVFALTNLGSVFGSLTKGGPGALRSGMGPGGQELSNGGGPGRFTPVFGKLLYRLRRGGDFNMASFIMGALGIFFSM